MCEQTPKILYEIHNKSMALLCNITISEQHIPTADIFDASCLQGGEENAVDLADMGGNVAVGAFTARPQAKMLHLFQRRAVGMHGHEIAQDHALGRR